MRSKELFKLIQVESNCEEYLRKIGVLKNFTTCINCGSDKLGIIRRNKYKCYRCKSEWSINKGSILSSTNIDYCDFLILIKLFEMELTAEKCAEELNLGYKSVHNLYTLIRLQLSELSSKDLEAFEEILKGRREIVVNYNNGLVKFEFNPYKEFDEAARLEITRHRDPDTGVLFELSLRKVKRAIKKGTGDRKFGSYNYFWRYAKEKLWKYRGTEQKYLILYLKEIEFRYNHRKEDLFEKICGKLSSFSRVAKSTDERNLFP